MIYAARFCAHYNNFAACIIESFSLITVSSIKFTSKLRLHFIERMLVYDANQRDCIKSLAINVSKSMNLKLLKTYSVF